MLFVGIFIGMHVKDFQCKIIDCTESSIDTLSTKIIDTQSSHGENTSKDNKNEIYTLPSKSDLDLSELWDVWDVIRNNYLLEKNISKQDILDGMIVGMVDSLDDIHSVFLKPDEAEIFFDEVSGELEGIGAEIGFKKKNLYVLSVLKDSPAFFSGLKSDDVILKIDDKFASDLGFFQSISMIRGKKGTDVKLSIYREDIDDTLEMTITRDRIDIKNMTWEVNDKIVHIEINKFTQNVGKELMDIGNEILALDPKGIVLDLRDNGGGLMDQAISISDQFIDDGVIVKRKMKGQDMEVFSATKDTIFSGIPLIVLINGESASASEIVAGAIQDNHVGRILGEKSYGKGSVQMTYDFGQATLKLTVAKWYTPSGKNVDKDGLEPDIEVKVTEESVKNKVDIQLEEAIRILKQ